MTTDAKVEALRAAKARIQELQDAIAESKARTTDLIDQWHQAVGDLQQCRTDILEEAVPGSCTFSVALPA